MFPLVISFACGYGVCDGYRAADGKEVRKKIL
jgi:hypothetical protein